MMHRTLFVTLLVLSAALTFGQQKDALEAYKSGRYADAIAITQDELKANSNNMDSYVVLCWSLQKLEKHQDALNYAQQALKLNPYDFRIIEAVGESSFYLGKNLEALKAFEQYVVLAPAGDRIEKAYYFMGEIYLQLGQYNRADIALTTAVYHSPQTAAWWSRLGYARMLAKDYPSAKKAYDEALRQNPGLTEAARGKQQVEALLAKAPAAN
jgi:tetratricopeptide (TPR) repeat protein